MFSLYSCVHTCVHIHIYPYVHTYIHTKGRSEEGKEAMLDSFIFALATVPSIHSRKLADLKITNGKLPMLFQKGQKTSNKNVPTKHLSWIKFMANPWLINICLFLSILKTIGYESEYRNKVMLGDKNGENN